MPNNIVFNNVAENLKTQIYGTTSSGTVTSLLVDNSGNVQIGGSITSTVTGTVNVSGGNINSTVTGTVNVSGGSITSTVTGTVSISDGSITATVTGTVNISGGSVSATIAGHGFTSSFATLTANASAATNTSFVFDSSQFGYNNYSFYVKNTGTATVSVRLQVSPTTAESYYVNDTTAEVTLTQNQAVVLAPGLFLNYTRLRVLGTSEATVTVEGYFNGQN